MCASMLGIATALMLALQGEPRPASAHGQSRAARTRRGPRTAGGSATPILLNLVFFVVLSLVGGGLNQYLVVGLQALHGTPPAVGNTALTGLLAMSAVGVCWSAARSPPAPGITRSWRRPGCWRWARPAR